jgi:hypothetical protein
VERDETEAAAVKFHTIDKVSFTGDQMVLDVDSKRVTVDLREASPRLASATDKQRQNFEISPSGYGIHWPELDEDLSVDGLLGIKHVPKGKFTESVAEGPPKKLETEFLRILENQK